MCLQNELIKRAIGPRIEIRVVVHPAVAFALRDKHKKDSMIDFRELAGRYIQMGMEAERMGRGVKT